MNLIMKDQADKNWLHPVAVTPGTPGTPSKPSKPPRAIILLVLAYQTLKTATMAATPAERVQKMHGFILMICVLGLFGITVYASINTALSSPLVNISHYALVDQNGEE